MIVGITGGMGSGKSSLARALEERGATRIDADRIGHEVITRPAICRAILAAFGGDLMNAAGNLDRRELGRRAFANKANYTRLNQIVHPALVKELRKQIDRAKEPRGRNVVVVDAALIFEWGDLETFDAIVVVDAKVEVRIERLIRGRGFRESEVRRRMACQLPNKKKTVKADWVVKNNGNLKDLQKEAEKLWHRLKDPGLGQQIQGCKYLKE